MEILRIIDGACHSFHGSDAPVNSTPGTCATSEDETTPLGRNVALRSPVVDARAVAAPAYPLRFLPERCLPHCAPRKPGSRRGFFVVPRVHLSA